MKQRKTRNQRKLQRIKNAAVAIATIGVWAAVGFLMVRSLDHPGEQPISGSEYAAEISQHAPEQRVIEYTVKEVPAEEPVMVYDVPLDMDLQHHIIQTCEDHHIDPAVVVAMIWQESRCNADAVGDDGNALGLMQIWPYWHSGRMERLGCDDLFDPYQNVIVGVDYLTEQLDRYDGDLAAAVTAYNRGHYAGEVSDYAESVLDMAAELRCE
jgi:hypothetical protein